MELSEIYKSAHPDTIAHADYFRALIKLQSELIRLQNWVMHSKEEMLCRTNIAEIPWYVVEGNDKNEPD